MLGTLVAISAADRRPERQLHAAIDAAFACMERIHRLMSFQAMVLSILAWRRGLKSGGCCRVQRHHATRPRIGAPLSCCRAGEFAIRSLCGPILAVSHIILNAGGDLRVAGPDTHCVRLRNPSQPRRSEHALGAHSVSVRAADCMIADALTKVVPFAPSGVAESVLTSCNAQAYVI